jgi:hypothetical protein
MTQLHVHLKSSQVRSVPSDHFRPSLRVQVTAMVSPVTTTPPFCVVGMSLARSGANL